MARLPQINLRLPDEHHALMRRIAHGLREKPGLAEAIEALLNGAATRDSPATPDSPGDGGRLDAIEARLAALEARAVDPAPVASVKAARTRRRSSGEPKSNEPIPPEHLAEAARLWDGGRGPSFAEIIKAKGWGYNRSSLHKAVVRWLERDGAGG